MRRVFSLALFLFLALPFAAHAQQTTQWDFSGNQIPGKWNISQTLQVQASADGLQIHANDQGLMMQDYLATHRADVIRIVMKVAAPTQVMLVLKSKKMPEAFQIPVQMTPDQPSVDITPASLGFSDPYPEQIGLGFFPGTDAILGGIGIAGWSLSGRLGEAWHAFWTFDTYQSYSINFVWGPLITTNPVARSQMFLTEPPAGVSVDRYFYLAFVIGVLLICAWQWWRHRQLRNMRTAMSVLMLFGALWLLYDLRMGSEFLSYAAKDYHTYISQPPENRVFRNYENFHVTLAKAVPLLMKVDRYGVLVPKDTQILGILKYNTYPSLPLQLNEDPSLAKLWFVFRRPDVTLDGSGQLISEGKVLAGPGEIVDRYDQDSFLFQVH